MRCEHTGTAMAEFRALLAADGMTIKVTPLQVRSTYRMSPCYEVFDSKGRRRKSGTFHSIYVYCMGRLAAGHSRVYGELR